MHDLAHQLRRTLGVLAAQIGQEIANLQTRLLVLAEDKTEQLYLASIRNALPNIRNGIRIKASRPNCSADILI